MDLVRSNFLPNPYFSTLEYLLLFKRNTEDPGLMRISLLRILLLRFFKTFQKNLPYAFFELIYFISATFGPKIAQKMH